MGGGLQWKWCSFVKKQFPLFYVLLCHLSIVMEQRKRRKEAQTLSFFGNFIRVSLVVNPKKKNYHVLFSFAKCPVMWDGNRRRSGATPLQLLLSQLKSGIIRHEYILHLWDKKRVQLCLCNVARDEVMEDRRTERGKKRSEKTETRRLMSSPNGPGMPWDALGCILHHIYFNHSFMHELVDLSNLFGRLLKWKLHKCRRITKQNIYQHNIYDLS